MILLADIETNQLEINEKLKAWCLVIMDWITKEVWKYPPNRIVRGLYKLQEAERVVFHNYLRYDKLVLEHLYPKLQLPCYDDTLIMSRLFDPDRHLHSIESYGVECGIMKPEHEEWDSYSPSMLHRCAEDVRILDYAYTKLMKERENGDWEEALQLEYDVALAHQDQVDRGVLINQEAAHKLLDHLDAELEDLSERIQAQLPLRVKQGSEVNKIWKKDGTYYAYVKKYFGLE